MSHISVVITPPEPQEAAGEGRDEDRDYERKEARSPSLKDMGKQKHYRDLNVVWAR
jgi:hypothetical protein